MKNECFLLLSELRKYDVFPDELQPEEMIDLFFPKTTLNLALDFSNVTSAFYGIFLQSCRDIFGSDKVNNISKHFFYNLGRTKAKLTRENIERKFEIPNDARGVVILLISAIYNASPEYNFKVTHYSPNYSEIFLSGSDRYYRIAKFLNIEKILQWPVLHSFMEGIRDELSIKVDISSKMLSMDDSGECLARYLISTTE